MDAHLPTHICTVALVVVPTVVVCVVAAVVVGNDMVFGLVVVHAVTSHHFAA